MYESSSCSSVSSLALGIVSFFFPFNLDFSHSNSFQWYLIPVSVYVSLITNNFIVAYLFMFLLAIYMSTFKCLLMYFALLKNWMVFFLLSFELSLYSLDTSRLSDRCLANMWLVFILLTVFFFFFLKERSFKFRLTVNFSI